MCSSLRGHDESSTSLNKGNFCEILYVLSKHDPVLRKRLVNSPHNATDLSPEIQNELLKIMSDMVRKSVVEGVKKAVLQMNQKILVRRNS